MTAAATAAGTHHARAVDAVAISLHRRLSCRTRATLARRHLGRIDNDPAGLVTELLGDLGGDQVDRHIQIDRFRVLILGDRGVHIAPLHIWAELTRAAGDRPAVLGVHAEDLSHCAALLGGQQFQCARQLDAEDAVGLGQRLEDAVVLNVRPELAGAKLDRLAIRMQTDDARQRQQVDRLIERRLVDRLLLGPAGALGLGDLGAIALLHLVLAFRVLGRRSRRLAKLHVVAVGALAQIDLQAAVGVFAERPVGRFVLVAAPGLGVVTIGVASAAAEQATA